MTITARDAETIGGGSPGYRALRDFLLHRMRMSHLYQPVMLRTLIAGGGTATVREIATAFLAWDESQLEYYEHVTKTMPGRVLMSHGMVRREGNGYRLRVGLDDSGGASRREAQPSGTPEGTIPRS